MPSSRPTSSLTVHYNHTLQEMLLQKKPVTGRAEGLLV